MRVARHVGPLDKLELNQPEEVVGSRGSDPGCPAVAAVRDNLDALGLEAAEHRLLEGVQPGLAHDEAHLVEPLGAVLGAIGDGDGVDGLAAVVPVGAGRGVDALEDEGSGAVVDDEVAGAAERGVAGQFGGTVGDDGGGGAAGGGAVESEDGGTVEEVGDGLPAARAIAGAVGGVIGGIARGVCGAAARAVARTIEKPRVGSHPIAVWVGAACHQEEAQCQIDEMPHDVRSDVTCLPRSLCAEARAVSSRAKVAVQSSRSSCQASCMLNIWLPLTNSPRRSPRRPARR